ncbi:N-acetyldiaminopimelate deacetylase [Lactobacillus sp. ESL0679]|uniref:N-acetyldiaminopimelate deacetylase n=1 Tax=Lactobacillus sp. ESL0679 TaxID=2983209 RepID=UPI0023F80ACD|nr:N-acetyldiaminopimelate deacetylase [Lactobacillus sp. ESL0679]MDF7682224.1 N-acetyldiaminopimelate deacetylase [Lactobacillus sp. ESL0679]
MTQFNEQDLIKIRRQLHQIPELALKETATQKLLLQLISELPQQFLTIKTFPQLPTAIMVLVKGKNAQKTIGYRADIDGLPIAEQNDLPYQSQHPGIMHACGHDLHMTIALGALSYFANHQPQDNLVFFFQPAEESESGAKIAYDQHLFTGQFALDEIYALHDTPQLLVGTIGTRQGTLFAGTTEVDVDFTGQDGHAAYPQNANDMIVAAAQFITQVQTIISRSIDPLKAGVITLGKMTAGNVRNAIAGTAHIEGTIRGLTQDMITLIKQRLREVATGVATSYGADIKISFNQGGYFPVVNDPQLTTDLITFLKQSPQVNFAEIEPAMTGEDFGYLTNQIPGAMFWLGVGQHGSLHSATFTPDEGAILVGVETVIGFLKRRMQNN